MWILLSDSFFSIVKKDCAPDQLMVRARRPGDIKRVFGHHRVTRSTDSDYLFRAAIPRPIVESVIRFELGRINYSNFKDSVSDPDLHVAYLEVWTALAKLQNPRPYSKPYRPSSKKGP